MESENIKKLLEKYWECSASEQEEEKLKEFFTQENVPEEFAEYKPLFQYFHQEKQTKLDESFDEKLELKIQESTVLKKRRSLWLPNLMKVAASLLIVLTCAYFYTGDKMNQNQAVLEDTYEDPEKAYAEVKAALMKVSKNLNQGTKYVVSIKQINEGVKLFKTDENQEKQ